jgi:hypothetical protein
LGKEVYIDVVGFEQLDILSHPMGLEPLPDCAHHGFPKEHQLIAPCVGNQVTSEQLIKLELLAR